MFNVTFNNVGREKKTFSVKMKSLTDRALRDVVHKHGGIRSRYPDFICYVWEDIDGEFTDNLCVKYRTNQNRLINEWGKDRTKEACKAVRFNNIHSY